MMKRKIIAFILAALVCFGMPFSAIALEVSVTQQQEAVRGETITYEVSLVGTVTANSGSISLEYDSDALTFVSGEWKLSGAMITNFDTDKAKGVFAFLSPTELSGTICTVTFLVAEDAEYGAASVSVDMNFKNTNNPQEDASPETVTGTVNVVCQEHQPGAEATCTTDQICTACQKVLVPALGHNNDGTWTIDGTAHWLSCSAAGCDYIFPESQGTHSSTGNNVANCDSAAVCDVCGVSYGEVDTGNHAGTTTIVDATTPTCSQDGYTGDTYCEECETVIQQGETIPATGDHVDADGMWEANRDAHFRTCGCGYTFDYTPHSGGTATCMEKAQCQVCGEAYGEINPQGHNYSEDFQSDATHHWKACACGSKIQVSAHNIGSWQIVQMPTATEDGLQTRSCTVCHAVIEQEVLPAIHVPQVSLVTSTDPVILDQTFEVYIVVSDGDPVGSAGFKLQYDTEVFELVEVDWLVDALVQTTTPAIASSWLEYTDINGELVRLVFRAKALTEGSLINAEGRFEIYERISVPGQGETVEVIECPHAEFDVNSVNNRYHENVCTVCGYTFQTAHSFDHSCDTDCNECDYQRTITHTVGQQAYDSAQHWNECAVCGEKLNVQAHSYDHNCDTDCNVCGAVREITHTSNGIWEHNEQEHWTICAVCGEQIETHAHEYDGDADFDCDTCGYSRAIPGDTNGDRLVNNNDVQHLLWHTLFPEDYGVSCFADFDRDGRVDNNDVVYLLWYTLFPEDYPLY